MNDEGTTESAPEDEQPLALDTTITVMVDSALKKALKWQRRVIPLLIGVILVLAANSGYLLNKSITHPLSNQLKSQLAAQQAQTKALETYVQQYAQHGCSALELLSAKPVPAPADPKANPSREVTYEFYQAILYWEHADGCKITAHNVTPVK